MVIVNVTTDTKPAFAFFISIETVCRVEPGLKQKRTAKKTNHMK